MSITLEEFAVPCCLTLMIMHCVVTVAPGPGKAPARSSGRLPPPARRMSAGMGAWCTIVAPMPKCPE